MNSLLLTLISLSIAHAQNTRSGCYQALDHSAKRGKPSVVLANSPNIWNSLLQDQIIKSREECKGVHPGKCLAEFLGNLAACDGVGDARLQTFVEETRRVAEINANAVRSPKALRPTEASN